MDCSLQEYWSGQPFPSPRDLPDPEIKPESPAIWMCVCIYIYIYMLLSSVVPYMVIKRIKSVDAVTQLPRFKS